jgi:hypothetical protein
VSPRFDELPDGIPASGGERDAATADILARIRRNPDGTPADAESASLLGTLGGLAKAERDRQLADVPALARRLGLRDVSALNLLPYLGDAEALSEHECARLARVVGGGQCGTAPAVIVASAALQIAGSRYAFARGELITGSRLADAARANLLSAHELAAREAQIREVTLKDIEPRSEEPDVETSETKEELVSQAVASALRDKKVRELVLAELERYVKLEPRIRELLTTGEASDDEPEQAS